METYKAWNKLHDPTTDACIHGANYALDYPFYQSAMKSVDKTAAELIALQSTSSSTVD